MATPNKRLVYSEIEQDEFRALWQLASHIGKSVSDIGAMAIRRLLCYYDVEGSEEKIPELIIYRNSMKAKRSDDSRNWLKDIAYSYQIDPSEENAELLQVSAKLAGVTMNEVLQWIQEDKLTPLREGSDPVDQAMEYLSRIMESGKEYPSTQIKEAAEKENILKYHLDIARRRMNIKAQRRSTYWVWIKD